jgi:hypothetical protein
MALAFLATQARRHWLYITSASAAQLAAQHLGAVYALRWEIELLFRELKSVYRIDHTPSGRRGVTDCLLYAALLTVAMSRRLLRLVAGGRPGLFRPFMQRRGETFWTMNVSFARNIASWPLHDYLPLSETRLLPSQLWPKLAGGS